MDLTSGESAESIAVQNRLAQYYNAQKDNLDKVMDEILEFHGGEVAKVKRGVFYREAKTLAAQKELTLYMDGRNEKKEILHRLGVDYSWLTSIVPSDIESKFKGMVTIIQDLKKIRLSALHTLNVKAKIFDADLERLLV